MKTNQQQLVMQSVCGGIHHPTKNGDGYYAGYDGRSRITVGVGGITYNFSIGDNCMNIAGDHIEPGVSLKNSTPNENNATLTLSCVGNTARVISGEAKGEVGIVTGKHGGCDHVMIYFPQNVLEKMVPNDQILIKSYGVGLKIEGYEDVYCMNLDPTLLEKMNIEEKDGKLYVPVTHIIPAYLMGSGLGSTTLMNCDYDIMTQDQHVVKELGLESLRFGDFVYIQDHYSVNGPHYKKGAGSLGVIVHSDSFTAGHGPGVTVLMTCHQGELVPVIDEHANLKEVLGL